MKSLLIQSRENKAPIMIFYIDKNGEVTQRIITVKAIGQEKIRAYCHYRKADRVFKIESILSCGPVRKRSAS